MLYTFYCFLIEILKSQNFVNESTNTNLFCVFNMLNESVKMSKRSLFKLRPRIGS